MIVWNDYCPLCYKMETHYDQVILARQPLAANVANTLAAALFTFAHLLLAPRL